MNQPQQPPDHKPNPRTEASPAARPADHAGGAVPDGAEDAEPKGLPTSDRHETETAPKR